MIDQGGPHLSVVPTSARVAPHDTEAERAVLGALLIDGQALSEIDGWLVPEDFFHERHAHLFRGAQLLALKGSPIDVVTLRAQLDRVGVLERSGGIEYLGDLSVAVPTAASIRHYAEIVADRAVRRRMIRAGGDITRAAFDEERATEAVLADAEATVRGLGRESLGGAVPTQAVLDDIWTDLSSPEGTAPVLGVPSGFSALDRLTGGWQNGEMSVIAARPSVGKSAFALQAAIHAARLGKNVVFWTLESPPKKLMLRALAMVSEVNLYRITRNALSSEERAKVAAACGELAGLPIRWESERPDTARFRSKVRAHQAAGACDLVFLDQLGLMQARNARDTRVFQVSEFSREVRAVAFEVGLPIVVAHQISRGSEASEKRKPQLWHLKDSGSIEEDGSVIVILHREWNNREQAGGPIEVDVAKNRDGRAYKFQLRYRGWLTRFDDLGPGGADAAGDQ